MSHTISDKSLHLIQKAMLEMLWEEAAETVKKAIIKANK